MKSIIVIPLLLLLTYCELVTSVPTLEVDVNTGRHPISDNIYGMNWMTDTAFVKEIRLPFDRWGGNAVTRYNWKLNVSNHAADWFFENIPDDSNSALTFFNKDKGMGTKTMLTVSLIGWTPKDRERRCGFSVKKYGQQQQHDQYMTDCGNGNKPDGKPITGNDPTDTSMRINGTFSKEFVEWMVKQGGRANQGGVLYWELDNEVEIWQGTHRDVHPNAPTADEILGATKEHASAIKAADPSALVLGPVGAGYMGLLSSGYDGYGGGGDKDRKSHGNLDFGAYYLKAMKEYEDQHKVRILDYLDYHFYPQCQDFFTNSKDPAVLARRLRCLKGLWDPTYVDEGWIKDLGDAKSRVNYIGKMRQYIQQYYPGTKIAITEYSMGQEDTMNGALAQADALGIFAREQVDLASLWGGSNAKLPVAYAIRMYRNYDGKGSHFGDTYVTAKSSDQDKLAIYASVRSSDKKLIVIVINKDPSADTDTKITITGQHSNTAQVFTYSSSNLSKIMQGSPVQVTNNQISHKFPAYSITLFEI